MRIKDSTYFLLVLALFMIIIFLYSFTYQHLETKLLPLILSGIIFILSIFEIGKELNEEKIISISEKDEKKDKHSTDLLLSYLSAGAWLIGFCIAIYLLGFLVAIPLFIIAYLKFKGRKWLSAIILAGSTTVLIWIGFSFILEVRLYAGLLFDLPG